MRQFEFTTLKKHFNEMNAIKHCEYVLKLTRAKCDVVQAILADEMADQWLDFLVNSFDEFKEQNQGFIYMAINANNPGLYKIGKTKNAPYKRIKQLNNEAVVGEIILVKHWAVFDKSYYEKLIHRKLIGTPRAKEFFQADYDYLVKKIDNILAHDYALLRKLNTYVALAPEEDVLTIDSSMRSKQVAYMNSTKNSLAYG